MPSPFERFVAPARPGAALWRLALGLGIISAVYIALNLGAALAIVGLTGRPPMTAVPGTTPVSALLMLLSFVPMVLGLILAVRLVHKRDGWSLLGEAWQSDFLRAAGLLILLYSSALLAWHLSGATTLPNLPPLTWVLLLPLAIGATLIQTLAEELLFRGYLLQQLAARFAARWLWFALPSLLFGFAHSQPGLLGDAWIFPVIAATVFGLIATDLTIRHGTLGMAWGLHFATNLFALTVVAAGPSMTGLSLRLAPHPVTELTDAPWLFLVDLLPLLFAWVLLRRRCQP